MDKKLLSLSLLLAGSCWAFSAAAQLPTNPWAPNPNDGYFENVPTYDSTKAPVVPEYGNGQTNGEVLPVDPWARARDRSGIKTWRGSGRHDRGLNYVGEATTYGTAYGQEMIAPEVNRHNMLVMTQHLRNLGYKIPSSYDQNIKDLPSNYAEQLRAAYDSVVYGDHTGNPIAGISSAFVGLFEEQTGLDTENLLFNSIDLLNTD